jgi:opacity protein-like surface antigen
MKILKFIVLLVTIYFFSGSLIAQPKFTIHLTGGYGVPLGDFKTEVPTTERADADWFPYYTKQLINVGLDGKLAIGRKGNFRVVLGGTYNMFSNSTDAVFRTQAPDTSGFAPTVTTSFKPKVNVISIFLGGEWAFMPKGKVNPYIGAGIAGNFFGGSFEFGQSVYVKGSQRTAPMDMKSETRIGIIFDGGVDLMLSKNVGAVIGVKYHMINPLGKGSDDPSEIGPNEIDLGDIEHDELEGTETIHFAARTISSINGYVGVSFYFGAPKIKTVKK